MAKRKKINHSSSKSFWLYHLLSCFSPNKETFDERYKKLMLIRPRNKILFLLTRLNMRLFLFRVNMTRLNSFWQYYCCTFVFLHLCACFLWKGHHMVKEYLMKQNNCRHYACFLLYIVCTPWQQAKQMHVDTHRGCPFWPTYNTPASKSVIHAWSQLTASLCISLVKEI